jgi:hypothetical protein
MESCGRLLIGLLAMQQKFQDADCQSDCQSAAGFHPTPLWLGHIPRHPEVRVSAPQIATRALSVVAST